MSKITLEQVERLMAESHLPFEDVKQALEEAEGDEAIALENLKKKRNEKLFDTDKLDDVIHYVKGLFDKGLAARLVIAKGEETVLNIPAGIGLLGILAPFLSMAGLGTALLTGHSIKIELKDGNVVDINEYVDKAYNKVKETSEELLKKDSNEEDESKE